MRQQPIEPIRAGERYGGCWDVESPVWTTELSEVWKCHHFVTRRAGALKVIAEDLVQQEFFRAKFESEVKILETMQHPNILGALGCFLIGPRYAVVTPWVEGFTLEKLINANPGTLPLEDCLPLAITILETLAEVHARNILHRDIKPNNILIEAATLKPFLIDFGIALVVGEPRKTKYGMVLGNPAYMSPEQIQRFHEVDSRSDIYAFGCVLFEMLTGRPPFESHKPTDTEKLYDVQRMQIYEPSPLLRDIRPDLPVQLEKVVAMALEKDPDNRFTSCKEFAEYLREIPLQSSQPEVKEEPESDEKLTPPVLTPPKPPRLQPFFHVMAPVAFLGGLAALWADQHNNWPFVILGTAALLVSYLVVIYNAWSALPESETKITGSSAVLWHFFLPIAMLRFFPGFIPAYNRHVSQNKLGLPQYNPNVGFLWAIVPFGLLFLPLFTDLDMRFMALACLVAAWAFLYVVVVSNICKAVNQLADLHFERAQSTSVDSTASNTVRN